MSEAKIRDILNFAAEREEEAAQSYGRMADQAKDKGLKQLLRELQDEERNHKKILAGLSPQKIHRSASAEIPDLKLTDFLAETGLGPDMDIQELLIFAAKKEQKAIELYGHLASIAGDQEHRELFEFLVNQEKSHKLKLETEYERHILGED
jgi:rubrerythrin